MSKTPRIVWVDLGPPGSLLTRTDPLARWHDHGMGLLRTILHGAGIMTDAVSTRAHRTWRGLGWQLRGYDILLMNVQSSTFSSACRVARLFKQANPSGLVLTGGIHASVALQEMLEVPEFDHICQGPGETVIVDLVRNPGTFGRVITGQAAMDMAQWPIIDRELWPRGNRLIPWNRDPWPLEPSCGWGPAPVASVLTSRVCPWRCAFCNESSFIDAAGRRPVESIIQELNHLDRTYGPLGSVVIHDSMFFQHPTWLKEWLEKYPRMANRVWPYWAAARADSIRKQPDLFEALVRETNWNVISMGLESGSDRVLEILNKECTVEDNRFAIELVNRIGDEQATRGATPSRIWANIMLGVPGETREDAFMTMAMFRSIRRPLRSLSFFAPYAGSMLGYQIKAEGKSLILRGRNDRHPDAPKVVGIDYGFYQELLGGAHESDICRCAGWGSAAPSLAGSTGPSRIYVFGTRAGRRKLGWGRNAGHAFEVLSRRLTAAEAAEVRQDSAREIRPHEFPATVGSLG